MTASSPASDLQLLDAFVDAIQDRSTREVARATGLSHQIVARYQRGYRPAHLRQASRAAMATYLSRHGWQPAEGLSDSARARLLELSEQLQAAVWENDRERAREVTRSIDDTLS